jgi:hypothetical protein
MLILQLFNLLVCLHLILYFTDQIIKLIWKMRIFSTTCLSMLNVRWFSDRFSILFYWEWIMQTRNFGSLPLIILYEWNWNNCSIKIRFFVWLNYMLLITCFCVQVYMLSLLKIRYSNFWFSKWTMFDSIFQNMLSILLHSNFISANKISSWFLSISI